MLKIASGQTTFEVLGELSDDAVDALADLILADIEEEEKPVQLDTF